ncbi:hypothetical protein NVP1261O_55 [Vibrio phage 1.261.O._10N.286.51.A7]|uniref:Uncharacterized protein n=1 Tax=Vibrio phage 1.261.O._10N.286.51.A7 TaxID=1881237 RepID=A0A2I7RZI1_9CAUD|nr:hypothetical protein HOU80_gp47 [Vibrio phage 1.261.O._10N.286.51.A7]AUR99059.1 hypothetical protein NVP1261O_55 [Vibrio phage 1.261.O._10N.286.51.A7]
MSLMSKLSGNKEVTTQEKEAGTGGGGFFQFKAAQIVQIKVNQAGLHQFAKGSYGSFIEFVARTSEGTQELQKLDFFADASGNFTPDYGRGEQPTSGYSQLNMITQLVSKGKKSFEELQSKAGKITIYGEEKDCDVIPSLAGKQMFVAIVPTRKNRMDKNPTTGKYDIPTNEEEWEYRIQNVLDKSRRTVFEIKKGSEAEWAKKFTEQWAKKEVKFIDKYKPVTAVTQTTGQATTGSVDELAGDDDL